MRIHLSDGQRVRHAASQTTDSSFAFILFAGARGGTEGAAAPRHPATDQPDHYQALQMLNPTGNDHSRTKQMIKFGELAQVRV